VKASLAASTGVEDAADVAAYLLACADVVMTTSALLRHGPEHTAELLDGLTAWMTRKGFHTLNDLRGKLALPADHGEAARERASYVDTLLAADRGDGPW
jgi:dihydroorotate dehydrogenase (fumarate)